MKKRQTFDFCLIFGHGWHILVMNVNCLGPQTNGVLFADLLPTEVESLEDEHGALRTLASQDVVVAMGGGEHKSLVDQRAAAVGLRIASLIGVDHDLDVPRPLAALGRLAIGDVFCDLRRRNATLGIVSRLGHIRYLSCVLLFQVKHRCLGYWQEASRLLRLSVEHWIVLWRLILRIECLRRTV